MFERKRRTRRQENNWFFQDVRTENPMQIFMQGEVQLGKSRGKTVQSREDDEEGVEELYTEVLYFLEKCKSE
jgi:hypothetical protein